MRIGCGSFAGFVAKHMCGPGPCVDGVVQPFRRRCWTCIDRRSPPKRARPTDRDHRGDHRLMERTPGLRGKPVRGLRENFQGFQEVGDAPKALQQKAGFPQRACKVKAKHEGWRRSRRSVQTGRSWRDGRSSSSMRFANWSLSNTLMRSTRRYRKW